MTLKVATTYVLMDEPCLNLSERDIKTSLGSRRMRVFEVIRGQTRAVYREDLGPSSQFTEQEAIEIPGGVVAGDRIEIVHTAGQLVDIMNYCRVHPNTRTIKVRDIQKAFTEHMERKRYANKLS